MFLTSLLSQAAAVTWGQVLGSSAPAWLPSLQEVAFDIQEAPGPRKKSRSWGKKESAKMHLRFSSQIEEIIGVELAAEDAHINSKQACSGSNNQEGRLLYKFSYSC